MSPEGRWVTSQIGSREHYAIPKSLNELGKLYKFYPDIWMPPTHKYLAFLGSAGHALLNRYDPKISGRTEPLGNINSIVRQRFLKGNDLYKNYCEYGSSFAYRLNKRLQKEISQFETYFTYNTGALETFLFLKAEGKVLTLGQIDPGRVERAIVKAENEKFPGWATDQYHHAPDCYFDRIEQEWALADYIIVNSEWSKKAIVKQGAESSKVKILPLSYEPHVNVTVNKKVNTKTLKVLFAANVILRKGIQYLFECAKQLKEYDIEFIVAGPINIAPHIVKGTTNNISFLGKIERNELYKFYLGADVYILPTLSDGFAITQIEAMSYGLPVIATSRCGEVVTSGVDGIVVNPYSGDELSSAILQYYNNREYLYSSSLNALLKAKKFSHKSLSSKITELFNGN